MTTYIKSTRFYTTFIPYTMYLSVMFVGCALFGAGSALLYRAFFPL